MRAEYLECGKIVNTHGIDGTLKLESWCDTPEILAGLEKIYIKETNSFIEHKIIKASAFKSFVLAKLDDVRDIDIAMKLKGVTVYAARADISVDEGAHFIADLIGLDVIDAVSGQIYGKITNVINGAASDIYVIMTENGEKMMPAVAEFVDRIDLESGIYVKPIEGIF